MTTAVTLLMPFDLGHSWIVGPDHVWPSGALPLFPAHVRSPLGSAVKIAVDASVDAELAERLQSIPWLHAPTIECAFLPVGLAILIVRGSYKGERDKRWPTYLAWESATTDVAPYGVFQPVALAASNAIERLVTRAGLHAIREVERKTKLHEFPWIFPLFFCDGATDEGAPEMDPRASATVGGADVRVRWKGADIDSTRADVLTEVETAFIAGSAAWQSLFIIDEVLSRLVLELFQDQEAGRPMRFADMRSLRAVRSFCRSVLDGSRPLRWTIDRELLDLLDSIHLAWVSQGMWKSIEDKIDLASLLFEQASADLGERRNELIGAVAFIIALVSTVSAASDWLQLYDPEATVVVPRGFRAVVALSLPVITGVLTWLMLRARGRARR